MMSRKKGFFEAFFTLQNEMENLAYYLKLNKI